MLKKIAKIKNFNNFDRQLECESCGPFPNFKATFIESHVEIPSFIS
jgi:hypothetical protein